MLLKFANVSNAVQAAADTQDAMLRRNRYIQKGNQTALRIGINLGDIITSRDADIHDDGVNVAARLEALSPTRGICISDVVYEQVHDYTSLTFQDMGPRQFKKIDREVHLWR